MHDRHEPKWGILALDDVLIIAFLNSFATSFKFNESPSSYSFIKISFYISST